MDTLAIRRLIGLTEQVHGTKHPTLFYFVYVYKAFDQVDWAFMKLILAKMEMGKWFYSAIDLIYSK